MFFVQVLGKIAMLAQNPNCCLIRGYRDSDDGNVVLGEKRPRKNSQEFASIRHLGPLDDMVCESCELYFRYI